MPVPESTPWLTDTASLAAIGGTVIALVSAAASWLKARDASIAARHAELRSDEAVAASKKAADALIGMLDFERAKLEAPGILEIWIARARSEGEEEKDRFEFRFDCVLAGLPEILAAHLAHQDKRILGFTLPPYVIGQEFHLTVVHSVLERDR